MNSRALILFSIGFWTLALAGIAPVSAQGGAPDGPEGTVASDDGAGDATGGTGDAEDSRPNETDGTDGTDGAVGDAQPDGTDGSGAEDTPDGADNGADNGGNSGAVDTPADGANGSATGDGSTATDGTDAAAPTGGDTEAQGSDDSDIGSTAAGDKQALIQRDVVPTVIIYEGKNVRMRLGGLIQMHYAPYVGADSLLANDDIATEQGFRIRRARFGFTGSFGNDFELQIVANPLESDPDVGTLSTARLSYQFLPGMFINVGTDSVPFTRAELESSAYLLAVERPLIARTIVPGRRLGITVTGLIAERLGFIVGFMNGTVGYELGNRFGGQLVAARFQLNLVGRPSTRKPQEFGLAISGGAVADNGPATLTGGASVDVLMTMAGASVKIEAMCDLTRPQDAPMPAPGLAADVTRCGAYAELGYMLDMYKLQPVVRAEYFDDNTQLEDAGDAYLFSVGANAEVRAFTRLQVHYNHRRERFSENRSNDSLVVNLQGAF